MNEIKQITEAIKDNIGEHVMHFCLHNGNLEILVKSSGVTIDISKLPNQINKKWIKLDPSGLYDETPEEVAPFIWKQIQEAAA